MISQSAFLPPEHFNFARPEEWPKWICKFERFRDATDLDERSEQKQVSSLMYAMGEQAEDILQSFRLTEEDRKSYTTVRDKFQSFFVKRRNIVYERCRFNQRCQEEGETAASFISDVYALAEYCGYGNLRDELIRDRLVVGIHDRRLSERLQLDADLTLEKAVTIIRQSETVHQQQIFLHHDNDKI